MRISLARIDMIFHSRVFASSANDLICFFSGNHLFFPSIPIDATGICTYLVSKLIFITPYPKLVSQFENLNVPIFSSDLNILRTYSQAAVDNTCNDNQDPHYQKFSDSYSKCVVTIENCGKAQMYDQLTDKLCFQGDYRKSIALSEWVSKKNQLNQTWNRSKKKFDWIKQKWAQMLWRNVAECWIFWMSGLSSGLLRLCRVLVCRVLVCSEYFNTINSPAHFHLWTLLNC